MMSSEEASNYLENRPIGTWILRNNESIEKRITVKSPIKVMQIRLYEVDGLFFSQVWGVEDAFG